MVSISRRTMIASGVPVSRKSRHRIRLAAIGVALAGFGLTAAARGDSVDAVWRNGAGNWSDGANWSCDPLYPNNTDKTLFDVTIGPGTAILDLLTGVSVDSLTLNGGSIDGPGNLTVNGPFNWIGGDMRGTPSAVTSLRGLTTVSPPVVVLTRTIDNSGTFLLPATVNGNGHLLNSGVLQTSLPATNIVCGLYNNGTVEAISGDLSFSYGTSGGRFIAGAGRTITIGGNGHTFNTGATFSGPGTTRLMIGMMRFDGNATVEGNLDLSTAQISGAGTIQVSSGGAFQWSGGTFGMGTGSGTVRVENGGLFNVSTTSSSRTLGDWNIDNAGTFLISVPGGISAGRGTITNSGNLRQVAAAPVGINAPVNNSGRIDVISADLSIGSGSASGTFNVEPGRMLSLGFSTDSVVLNTGANFTGRGVARVGGLRVAGNATVSGNMDLYISSITGSGDLRAVNGGAIAWSGATFGRSADASRGTLSSDAGGSLIIPSNGSSTKDLGTWSINNGGTFLITPATNVTFVGSSGSEINNSGTVQYNGPTASAIRVPFNNTGTVQVISGELDIVGGGTSSGTFHVGAAGMQSSPPRLTIGAPYTMNSGTVIDGPGTTMLSSGTLTLGGTVLVPGVFDITSGGRLSGSGELRATDGGLILISASPSVVYSAQPPGRISTDVGGTILVRSPFDMAHWTVGNAGTMLLTSTAGITGQQGKAAIDNTGVIQHQASGSTTISVAMNNDGLLDAPNLYPSPSADLHLAGGGTSHGEFRVGTGRVLWFDASHVFGEGSQFTGAGITRLAKGTATITGTTRVRGYLDLAGGSIDGAGDLRVMPGGLLYWASSGAASNLMGTGTVSIESGGEFAVGFAMRDMGDRTINNAGRMVLSSNASPGILYPAAEIIGKTGVINNSGTLLSLPVAGPAPAAKVRVPLNNTGIVDATAGDLLLANGGTSTGTFITAPGRTIYFDGVSPRPAPHILRPGTKLMGGGTFNVAMYGQVSGTFELVSGKLENYGSIELTSPTDFVSPTAVISNFGMLSHANTGTSRISIPYTGTGAVRVTQGKLIIDGPFAPLSGTTFSSGSLWVESDASVELPAGTKIVTNKGGITLNGPNASITGIEALATNQGSFSISGQDFTAAGAFSNPGALYVGSGATFTAAGTIPQISNGELTAGTWDVAGSLLLPDAGNIVVNKANLKLTAGYTFANVATLSENRGALSLYVDGFTPAGDFLNSGDLKVMSFINEHDFTSTGKLTVVGYHSFTNEAGQAVISGQQDWEPGSELIANGGSVALNSTIGEANFYGPSVKVRKSAAVALGADQYIDKLEITGGTVAMTASQAKLLRVRDLAIDSEGLLDLADGALVVAGTADTADALLAHVAARVGSARNSPDGPWRGRGITSSTLGDDPMIGLGVLFNRDADGNPIYSTFEGLAVDQNSILVKRTAAGDADLSGRIDGSDYFRIDKGFLSQNMDAPLKGWQWGDFDHSGKIDGSDYFLIDKAYLAQLPATPQQAVPEPGAAALLLLAGLVIRRRR